MQPSPRATLWVLMLVTVLGTAGIALPYPVLAPFFSAGDNALTRFLDWHPNILLGLALAIYPLGVLIGSSFLGALSDRRDRRQLLVVSLVAATAGYLLSALAIRLESFPLLLLARLLTGLCEGNVAIARAMAAELHPAISRTRALSLLFAATYAGWLIGPIIGGYTMPLGVEAVFLLAAGASLLCAALVAVCIRDRRVPPAGEPLQWQQLWREHSFRLFKYDDIKPYIYFQLLFCLGTNAFYEFYPLWLVDSFAASSKDIANTTIAVTLVMIVTSILVVTPLAARLGKHRVLMAANLTFALTLLILPFTQRATAWVLFGLSGGLIALVNGVYPAMISERFDHYGQGNVMGLSTTLFFLANVIMAVAGGWISVLGSHWALVTGGICCLLAWGWFAGAIRSRRTDDGAAGAA
ncbi:MFS transporter [Exilibacterium tricleocarpae]|uniref:MFS transporter n=1 Tax=Exilibacterium tricleocarpae TaxID=2591008 RepID=A0A545UA19_9GAMM|nr:MFS transporter [Exilibacterium tricleocarpae]TQV86279.1 MFS transporter [Exilibacterium tricleocarpae]